jgi:hypothetical protein
MLAVWLATAQQTMGQQTTNASPPDSGHPLPEMVQPATFELPEHVSMPRRLVLGTAGYDKQGAMYLFPLLPAYACRMVQKGQPIAAQQDADRPLEASGVKALEPVMVEITFVDVLNDQNLLQHVFQTGNKLRRSAVGEIYLAHLAAPISAELLAYSAAAGKAVPLSARVYPVRANGRTFLRVQFDVRDADSIDLLRATPLNDLCVQFSLEYNARFSSTTWQATGRVASTILTELVGELGGSPGSKTMLVPVGGSLSQNQQLRSRADAKVDLFVERRQGAAVDPELLRSLVNRLLEQAETQLKYQQLRHAESVTFLLAGGLTVKATMGKINELQETDLKHLEDALRAYRDGKTVDEASNSLGGSASFLGIGASVQSSSSSRTARSNTKDDESLHKDVQEVGRVLRGEVPLVTGIDAQQALRSSGEQDTKIGIENSEFVHGVAQLTYSVSLQQLSADPMVSLPKTKLMAQLDGLKQQKQQKLSDLFKLLDEVESHLIAHATGDNSLATVLQSSHDGVVDGVPRIHHLEGFRGWGLHCQKVWNLNFGGQNAQQAVEQWLDGRDGELTRRQEIDTLSQQVAGSKQAFATGIAALNELLTVYLPAQRSQARMLLDEIVVLERQVVHVERELLMLDNPPSQSRGSVAGLPGDPAPVAAN